MLPLDKPQSGLKQLDQAIKQYNGVLSSLFQPAIATYHETISDNVLHSPFAIWLTSTNEPLPTLIDISLANVSKHIS